MPCIPVPNVPTVPIPSPLSIVPPLPAVPAFAAGVCCVQVTYKPATPPLPLPALAINPAVVAALRQANQQVQAFIDGLQPPCPKNGATT
jgi:hypothetical protein